MPHPAPVPRPPLAAPPFSLLRQGVGVRLAMAGGAGLVLWLAVAWAVA